MASRQGEKRGDEAVGGEVDITREQQLEEEKRGVIGSMLKAVQGTYESAKEVVVGKRDPTIRDDEVVHHVDVDVNVGDDNTTGEVRDISADKSRGVYDSATWKAKEYGDKAGSKVGEYAGYAGEKAKEAKDRTMEKGREYKDYAAEKAKEGKDYTAEKAKEGKDSAADVAKRAMGYLGEKKEETKEKTAETAEAAKNKTGEAKDKTKEKLSGAGEEARRKAEELKEQGSNKGKGYGEEKWGRGNEGKIKAEDTRTGTVAETLKASDQMTGQTFNDVGRMDDEGTTRVGHLDIKK